MLSLRSIWREASARYGQARAWDSRSFGTEVPSMFPDAGNCRVLQLEVAESDHAAGLNVLLRISRLTRFRSLQKIVGWEFNVPRKRRLGHG